MPKNIILKNQNNSFTRKNFKSEKLRKWPKKGQKLPFFGPWRAEFLPFFTIFGKSLLNMPKNIILKNQKNSLTRKISKSKKPRKWPKKGQKLPFFGTGGPNFDPFFTKFCKSLLNMPKNIILKNQKNSFTGKISKLKNCKSDQKRTKNGYCFFGHFRSFSDLEIFLVNEFFCFFNMMFLCMFRGGLQKMVKKGQNSSLQGQNRSDLHNF